jgi:hypothetical protein
VILADLSLQSATARLEPRRPNGLRVSGESSERTERPERSEERRARWERMSGHDCVIVLSPLPIPEARLRHAAGGGHIILHVRPLTNSCELPRNRVRAHFVTR